MEELIILRQQEFQILAAALGIKEIFGLRPRKDVGSFKRTDFLYVVHEMAQKGILEPKGTEYAVQEPYRSLMRSVGEAGRILAVEERKERAAAFYFGSKLACLEESVQDEDAVRMGLYVPGECRRVLEEMEFLPPPRLEADLAALQTEKEAREWLDRPFAFRYLIFDRDKCLKAEFCLMDTSCNYWIVEKGEKELLLSRYSPQDLYEKIQGALKEEER